MRPLFHIVMCLATLLASAAGVLSWGASFIPPTGGHAWSLITLAMPAVVVANALCVVVWLVEWRPRRALLPLLALLINGGYLAATLQPFERGYRGESDLRVATLNAYQFEYNGCDLRRRTAEAVMRTAAREGVDILCLQEFSPYTGLTQSDISKIFGCDTIRFNNHEFEAIVSRHPIIFSEYRRFTDAGNGYLWADLRIGGDTVRVISVHLQTTGVSQMRSRFADEGIDEAGVEEMLRGVERNSRIRAAQVEELQQIVDTTRHPLILAGDFNDTPSSYTYRRMRRRLTDGFREAGHGFGGTFLPMGGVLRIDYIMASEELECTSYETMREEFSDHRMVVAGYRLTMDS